MCIVDKCLFIFKFAHARHTWVQLKVRTDEHLQLINLMHSSVYVGRTDSLYFFDHNNFANSRLLNLFRERPKEGKNKQNKQKVVKERPCSSALLHQFNFRNTVTIQPNSGFRVAYVMEDVPRKQREDTWDILPVIYILSYRELLAPLPLAVTRFSYRSEDNDMKFDEFTSKGIAPNFSQGTEIRINIQTGAYFILSDKSEQNEKPYALYFYSEINNEPMLIKGVFRKDSKDKLCVYWSTSKLLVTVFEENNLTEKKK